MWVEGHRVLCLERHFNILFSMYCSHILYVELKFSCFHWWGFRLLHNLCLYLLLNQVTIDLVHYHIVHINGFLSIVLCSLSGHHAHKYLAIFKDFFLNAYSIKNNIAHSNLQRKFIFLCFTFPFHWVVFLVFMEEWKWINLLNHILLHILDDLSWRPSSLVPWKSFKHIIFHILDSTHYTQNLNFSLFLIY
jgi:hypothetical protein